MKNKNQISLFWESHNKLAAQNHRKMAEMQRKIGRHDLAQESEKVAIERETEAEKHRLETK